MCHYSVGDVDGEIIGRIARSSLRHENEAPGAVECRAGLRDGVEGDQAAQDRHTGEKLLHCLLQAVSHTWRAKLASSMRLAGGRRSDVGYGSECEELNLSKSSTEDGLSPYETHHRFVIAWRIDGFRLRSTRPTN